MVFVKSSFSFEDLGRVHEMYDAFYGGFATACCELITIWVYFCLSINFLPDGREPVTCAQDVNCGFWLYFIFFYSQFCTVGTVLSVFFALVREVGI